MVDYRSVSQLKQYQKCGYSYYLARIERVWERPAAWLPQGLAVHEAAEEYEKSGRTMSLDKMQDVFQESYANHTNRMAEQTPNFDYWFASGPYKGAADVERRFNLGMDQVVKYKEYYEQKAPQEVIWITPDGEPAIELRFDLDLDGTKVVGYIDQVIEHPEHGIIVRDIKTGNKPGDDFQLAVYAVAVNDRYDTEISVGDYWMGRAGKPTVPYKLDDWSKEAITEQFKEVDEGIRAERFDPDPEESKCRFCSVETSCPFSALRR